MEQILKLTEMLMNVNAQFTLTPLWDGWQVCIFYKGKQIDDAVWNKGSRGHERGLLETSILGNYEGYETAQQIFDGWEQMFAELED